LYSQTTTQHFPTMTSTDSGFFNNQRAIDICIHNGFDISSDIAYDIFTDEFLKTTPLIDRNEALQKLPKSAPTTDFLLRLSCKVDPTHTLQDCSIKLLSMPSEDFHLYDYDPINCKWYYVFMKTKDKFSVNVRLIFAFYQQDEDLVFEMTILSGYGILEHNIYSELKDYFTNPKQISV